MCDGSCTVGDNVSQASSRVGPGFCRIGADWKRVHHGQAGERRAASMLFLFSVVFGTLGVALGKVSTACPASCVSDGLLNGQHLVRVGTNNIPRRSVSCATSTLRDFGAIRFRPRDTGAPEVDRLLLTGPFRRTNWLRPLLERTHMKLNLIALGLLAVLAGCTTAGPYVTNISSDGRNGLNIEKCAVKMNAFMGTVSTTECTSQNVQLSRGN